MMDDKEYCFRRLIRALRTGRDAYGNRVRYYEGHTKPAPAPQDGREKQEK